MSVYEKLFNIQQELKAPKGQFNSFGKYKYRSLEDILEAVKPLLAKNKCVLTLSDSVACFGEGEETIDGTKYTNGQRFYITAEATLCDIESGEVIRNRASARESYDKKGMDSSQITGTASSYARKYCLNGLFSIDDTKDADTDEFKKQSGEDSFREKAEEEQATELELKSFRDTCESMGLDYKEIWKQTGKAKDMSKAHLGKAVEFVIQHGNAVKNESNK